MRGGEQSYPGVQLAAWNVTIENLHQIYCFVTSLKLPATFYSIPLGQLHLAVS